MFRYVLFFFFLREGSSWQSEHGIIKKNTCGSVIKKIMVKKKSIVIDLEVSVYLNVLLGKPNVALNS